MPGTTTNFGIRFPCSGETIDPTVFQNFAEDVDTALATVDTAQQFAQTRPAASVFTNDAGSSVAVGVRTAMTFTTTAFNNGMTVGATTLTAITGGIYMVTAEFADINAGTTNTSWTGSIDVNATTVVARTLGRSTSNASASNINVSMLTRVTAGSTISAYWFWLGSGGPMFVYCNLSAQFICDL